MKESLLQGILLLDGMGIEKMAKELSLVSSYFLLPCFLIAICIEYFTELDFPKVVKNLLLIFMFTTFFYQFHFEGTRLSLNAASEILTRVSPNNFFIKKWNDKKLNSVQKNRDGRSLIDQFIVPNLNDLVATLFYVLGKVMLWLLKLIYSTVYHLTYVFSGITALLYFFSWTKNALKGTVIASLWCMIVPFVIVAILSMVGNHFEEISLKDELIVSHIDQIIWLFGVTVLLLFAPFITFGILSGDGVAASGAKVASMMGATVTKIGAYAGALKMVSQNLLQNAATNGIMNKINPKEKSKSSNSLNIKNQNSKDLKSNNFSNNNQVNKSSNTANNQVGKDIKGGSFNQTPTKEVASNGADRSNKNQSTNSNPIIKNDKAPLQENRAPKNNTTTSTNQNKLVHQPKDRGVGHAQGFNKEFNKSPKTGASKPDRFKKPENKERWRRDL